MKAPIRIALVGPLPPPYGGMANQTRQLAELLRSEGVSVEVIRVNPPYRPAWLEKVSGVRALFRLLPYLSCLWAAAGRNDLFHIMANSGWSWHLHAVPAIWIAHLRGKAVVVNYRGGEAEEFFARAFTWVKPSLKLSDAIIVPSGFLVPIFGKRGFATRVVPNIINLERFVAIDVAAKPTGPHLLVARNLEPLYDNATALRAFAICRQKHPGAHLTIAGSGPERETLEQLARSLGIADAVQFAGRVENSEMPSLYQTVRITLNPSLADNMPISILESLASGVPVVSTNVGGVPFLVEHDRTALLVPPHDAEAMADACLRLLSDSQLAQRLISAGHELVNDFAWSRVRGKLFEVYFDALRGGTGLARRGSGLSRIYTRVVSAAFFPLQERLKHHNTVAVRREMDRSQWWSTERIRQWQIDRLRAFLCNVQEHVPYYRSRFADISFDPSKVTDISELSRLPFLTKEVIRAQTEALKAGNAQGLARFNTGGSSGEPLIFFIGNERVSHDVAAKWRATRWWGVDIGDPEIVVWGSPIELGSQDRVRQVRDKLMRTKLLPAFAMSVAKLDEFVAEIRAMRPKMLFGYPSAIAHIARHAEARGIAMNDLGVKVAFVTSERLYDHQRAQIEKIFGCRVANGYGGRDAGFIAHQCPSGGMHITAEDIIVEIVGPNDEVLAPGLSGEIVVTHLATRDFPFIRYRTGDVGVLGDKLCDCGRGLPLLKEIQGRATDFVVAQDGTVMHGLALIYVVRDLPGVKEFKIVQESLELTRILLVTAESFPPDGEQVIMTGLKQRLGAMVDVRIEYVDAIPKEISGKFRYIVSKVAPDNARNIA